MKSPSTVEVKLCLILHRCCTQDKSTSADTVMGVISQSDSGSESRDAPILIFFLCRRAGPFSLCVVTQTTSVGKGQPGKPTAEGVSDTGEFAPLGNCHQFSDQFQPGNVPGDRFPTWKWSLELCFFCRRGTKRSHGSCNEVTDPTGPG